MIAREDISSISQFTQNLGFNGDSHLLSFKFVLCTEGDVERERSEAREEMERMVIICEKFSPCFTSSLLDCMRIFFWVSEGGRSLRGCHIIMS